MGVPHAVKCEKHQCVNISRKLLKRYGENGTEMLQPFVAINETWIWSCEPELKCQSSEWHTKISPRPITFIRSQNCAKMLMIFAYDFRGVLTAHRVPTGETVNKEYYKMYIRTILRPVIRRKRQEMIDRTLLILHDNVSPP